jgi:hypothetical protein
MASNVVRATLLADAQRFKAGFKDAEQAAGGFEQRIDRTAGLVKAVLAGAAVAAVKQFVDDSVAAFSNLNESLNALEVQYGSHADGIKQLGQAAAGSIGESNAKFNQFAVSISSFASQIAGDGGDVVGVVDDLSKRTADFASVMNLDFSEASEKFRSGLAGESEPLRQYGIDVSAARVETFAYANGIAVAGEELTEAQKVQARYGTIMEQTSKTQGDFANTAEDYANKTRIAAAETENHKALIGETLVPIKGLQSELDLLANKTLAVLTVQFNQLFGNISDADGAIAEFQILTGQAADSLEAAVTINKEYGTSFEDLFAKMQFSEDGLHRLTGENEEFLRSIGYSQEEIDELSRLIDDRLVRATNDARDAARHHKDATDDQTGGMEELGGKTDEATSALQRFEDEVRSQIDPLFAAWDAEQRLAEAQQAVIDLEEDKKNGTPEWEAAVRDLISANLDMEAALIRVATETGITRGEFETQLRGMKGVTDEMIQRMLEKFDELNFYNWRTQIVTIEGRQVGFGLPRVLPQAPEAHDGAIIDGPPGSEVLIRAMAGETIHPTHKTPAATARQLTEAQAPQPVQRMLTINLVFDGRVLAQVIRDYDRALLPD